MNSLHIKIKTARRQFLDDKLDLDYFLGEGKL